MYPKYSNKVIVINQINKLEHDKVFLLYSDRFGLLYANAISFRKQGAKLKYVLSNAIVARVTLIRAKSGWKLTEANEVLVSFSDLDMNKIDALYRILKLFLKLVPANSNDPSYFDLFEHCIQLLCNEDKQEAVQLIEVVAVHDFLAKFGAINSKTFYLNDLGTAKPEELAKKINTAIQFIF